MPLFFMLSGAVLALKPIGSFDQFVKSKFKRLIIPYFLYGCFFMLPVKYAGGFYTKEKYFEALRSFLQGGESGHLWFLLALFWCMVVFVLCYKSMRRFRFDSNYFLLLVSGVIRLCYSSLPFDFWGFKSGLSYLFWFTLGYVFECERKKCTSWNLKKTVLAYGLITLVEIQNRRWEWVLLTPSFLLLFGGCQTILFSDICSRAFLKAPRTPIWKGIIRNLFYVYLFHDPLEYVVLRIFIGKELLSSGLGCIMYTFLRTIGVFVVSIVLGELVRILSSCFKKLLEIR